MALAPPSSAAPPSVSAGWPVDADYKERPRAGTPGPNRCLQFASATSRLGPSQSCRHAGDSSPFPPSAAVAIISIFREETCAKEGTNSNEGPVRGRIQPVQVRRGLGRSRRPATTSSWWTCREDALDGLGPDFVGETLTGGTAKSALVLEECGVRRATHLVAATGDDASSLLIAELASGSSACPTYCPSWTTTLLADVLDDMGIAPSAPSHLRDRFFRLTGLTRKEADPMRW